MDQHHSRRAHDARNRRDVADEIEIEFVVKCRVDGAAWTDHEQRVAIRCRLHDSLGGNIGAGSRPIFDDEWLAESLRLPLTHQARKDVGPTARGNAHDPAHRPQGISFCPGNARQRSECGSTGCQMQDMTARKLHDVLLMFGRFDSEQAMIKDRQADCMLSTSSIKYILYFDLPL